MCFGRVSHNAIMIQHIPLNDKDLDLGMTVPILIHGDDAESHRRRSFMVLTFGSAVIHATPWDSKLVCYVGDNSQCCDETYSVLDAWVAWSLVELMLGHYLDVDPWGRPFERAFDAEPTFNLTCLWWLLAQVGKVASSLGAGRES